MNKLKLGEGVLADDFDHTIVMKKPDELEPVIWEGILKKASDLGYQTQTENPQGEFILTKSGLINILNHLDEKYAGYLTLRGQNINLALLELYLSITQMQMPPENTENRIRKFPGLK